MAGFFLSTTKHASLDHLIEDFPKIVRSSYVIHPTDFRVDGNVTYIPIYMAGLL